MTEITFPKDDRGIEFYDPAGEDNVKAPMPAPNYTPAECDALRAQLASVQATLDGYKSGVKEGADMLKDNLKRVEEENMALRTRLDEAMEVLALIRTNLPPLWVRELIDEYLQKIGES